jgi:hypothetical protein
VKVPDAEVTEMNTFINTFEMSVLNQVTDQYRDEIGSEEHVHADYYAYGCIACLKEGIINSIRAYIDQTEEMSKG